MGRRLVEVDPTIIMEFVTEGNTWGYRKYFRVTKGIPTDAKFIRGWYMPEMGADGVFTMLFDHPSWPETADGARYPTFIPQLTTEQKEDGYPSYLPFD